MLAEGFSESPIDPQDERLLGLNVSCWRRDASRGGADATLYLEHRGFGVLVDRATSGIEMGDHTGVVGLLAERKRLHVEVRQGTHVLALLAASLRDQIEPCLPRSARSSMWDGVPYVFTFYVDEDCGIVGVDGEHVSKEAQASGSELPARLVGLSEATLKGILALSEPSKLGLEDTDAPDPLEPGRTETAGAESIADRIAKLAMTALPPDVDVNDAVYCGATWASLVVVGRSSEPGSTVHAYELLEVRTQIAWLAAHLVRRWCERSHSRQESINSSDLDEIRWQVIPLLREASRLSDAGMSTRHVEIYKGLRRTSGLDEGIEAAEDTLRWSFEAAERLERRHRRRYELAVEVLLGLLAALQLATLIYELPLVSLPRWAASAILVAFASTLALFVAQNRRY